MRVLPLCAVTVTVMVFWPTSRLTWCAGVDGCRSMVLNSTLAVAGCVAVCHTVTSVVS